MQSLYVDPQLRMDCGARKLYYAECDAVCSPPLPYGMEYQQLVAMFGGKVLNRSISSLTPMTHRLIGRVPLGVEAPETPFAQSKIQI